MYMCVHIYAKSIYVKYDCIIRDQIFFLKFSVVIPFSGVDFWKATHAWSGKLLLYFNLEIEIKEMKSKGLLK